MVVRFVYCMCTVPDRFCHPLVKSAIRWRKCNFHFAGANMNSTGIEKHAHITHLGDCRQDSAPGGNARENQLWSLCTFVIHNCMRIYRQLFFDHPAWAVYAHSHSERVRSLFAVYAFGGLYMPVRSAQCIWVDVLYLPVRSAQFLEQRTLMDI